MKRLELEGTITREDFISLGFENSHIDDSGEWLYPVPGLYVNEDEMLFNGDKLNVMLIGLEDSGTVWIEGIGGYITSPEWVTKESVARLITALNGDNLDLEAVYEGK